MIKVNMCFTAVSHTTTVSIIHICTVMIARNLLYIVYVILLGKLVGDQLSDLYNYS